MKKKIGDLTLREIANICKKHSCLKCPFKIETLICSIRAVIDEKVNQEIEVEEIENNICDTCRLNNQCPIEHKPNLKCPYNDYEKR